LPEHPYYTLKRSATIEYTIRKSRFISLAQPVQSKEEVEQLLQAIRKQHPQANHHCYAYVINAQQQKASDDGEPQGTAGRPILDIIKAKQCIYTAVIVTRYFGGIKLGKGGLVRAYQQAAQLALEEAGIGQKQLYQKVLLRFPYECLGTVEYQLHQNKYYYQEEPSFDAQVNIPVWIPVSAEPSFQKEVQNWSNGLAKLTPVAEEKKYLFTVDESDVS
jgi:uncharacterized YigZ family protein